MKISSYLYTKELGLFCTTYGILIFLPQFFFFCVCVCVCVLVYIKLISLIEALYNSVKGFCTCITHHFADHHYYTIKVMLVTKQFEI